MVTSIVFDFKRGCFGLLSATLFEVPSPTPWEHLNVNNTNNGGVNFGVGGAGVTFALGFRTLAEQVDAFEKLVNASLWTKDHLQHSVALVSIGINDYTSFNINGTIEVNDLLSMLFSIECLVCIFACKPPMGSNSSSNVS